MTHHLLARVCLLALAAATAPPAAVAAAEPAARPNIVVILADDLGYGDLPAYGATDLKTPAIDSLASRGVRFTQFYACPECTPTRASLLTGRYPQRVGGLECAIGLGNVGRYDDAIRLREKNDLGLPPDLCTLPRLLKAAGYATGLSGKWHLGYEPKFNPLREGFDHFFGPMGGGIDYFKHTEPNGGEHMLFRGEKRAADAGYMTDLIAGDAVAFIAANKARPFFLYAAFNAPHDPHQAPDDPKIDSTRATYVKMIERLDRGVGRILKALDDHQLAGRTLVVFASDNGGVPRVARNAPFTRGKGTTFEGGIRVPCIARWPGVLPEGKTADLPGMIFDLTASFTAAAGAEPPRDLPFDGIDLLRHIRADAPAEAPPARPLFWRLRRGENTRAAARDGPLKYIREKQRDTVREYLFDVVNDPAEQTSLLDSRPEDAARLRRLLDDWETRVRPAR